MEEVEEEVDEDEDEEQESRVQRIAESRGLSSFIAPGMMIITQWVSVYVRAHPER